MNKPINTASTNPGTGYAPWFGVVLLALAGLAYEILLTRLFAIIQWHHFAYMIISLALLGYGASGALLVFVRARWSARPRLYFAINAISFGLLSVLVFLLTQEVDFNPFELAWGWSQSLKLALVYFLLMLPFFFVANALGLALVAYRGQENRIYSADLLGAGAGGLLIVGLLFLVPPMQALLLVGLLGCMAGVGSFVQARWRHAGMLLVLALLLGFGLTGINPPLKMSAYKDLAQAMQIGDMQQLQSQDTPLGQFHLTHSDKIPARHAPGLGLASVTTLPPQYSLYFDGHANGAVTVFNGDRDSIAFVAELTSAAAYQISDNPRVLVLGAGSGLPVLQATYHRAQSVDAVELHQPLIEMFSQYSWTDWAQSRQPRIRWHNQEPRSFIRHDDDRYDLIQLMLVDAYGAGAAGLHALEENYLYTTQAMTDYLRHLGDDGLLSLTRWYESPPRDSLRLIATAIDVLKEMGAEQPGRHLVVLRSWQTVTVIVAKQALKAEQLNRLRDFCQRHGFDLSYAADIQSAEVNRFNRSHQPFLYQGARAVLSDRVDDWQDSYPFDISPVNDGRPYFFHSFRWAHLDRLLDQAAGLGKAQLEWGYLVLWVTLAVAIAGSFLLIMLPLWFGLRLQPDNKHDDGPSRLRLFVYFTGLGLGFMFIEIAFIQYFILLLGHPLYSVAIVLTSFLLFAGVGSFVAQRWQYSGLRRVLLGIVIALPLYLLLLPLVFSLTLGWAEIPRLLLAVLLIAPLAFLMGVPFPAGLAKLSKLAPAYSPWAWGINGCASVTAVILAKLLAMAAGFAVVLACAMLVYGLAAFSIPQARRA